MYATFFDRYLVERELLTESQRLRVLQQHRQANQRIGALALELGYLTNEELRQICQAQRPQDRLFGELAVEMGLLSQEELQELLAHMRQVPLTDVLIEQRLLPPHEVARAWIRWRRLQDWRTQSNQLVMEHLNHAHLVESVLEVCRKQLHRLTDIRSELATISHDPRDLELFTWALTVPLHGEFRGRLVLSAEESVWSTIAAQMCEQEVSAHDVQRQAEEFVGLIAGQIQRRSPRHLLVEPPRLERNLHRQALAASSVSATAMRLDLLLPDHRPATLSLGLLEDHTLWRTTESVTHAA